MSLKQNHISLVDNMDQQYWGIFEAVSDGLIVNDSETYQIVEANSAAAAMHGYSRKEFIGLQLKAYIHPDSLDYFTKSAQVVRSGGKVNSSAIHLHRDGSPFSVEVHRTAFIYQSRSCLLSVVREVSRQTEAEQLLFKNDEVRQREQSILLDISHALASSLELKPDFILNQLAEIIKFTHAALFILEDSMLVAAALRGIQHLENTVPFRIRMDNPEILERLFNKHRPIRIADVSGNGKEARFLRLALRSESSTLLEGVQAWMWVPLAVKGRIIGGIGVAHSDKNYFTKHHADLALTVANQAAITLVNAQLYKEAQALAVLQERQRLAQNLHDAINQSLFSVGLIAEVLPRLWERDQALARESLQDLRRLTLGAQAEMRALLAELRPSALTDAELIDLLQLLINSFSGRANIPANINVDGRGNLPAKVQVAFYRICQEALNNIAKHARANKVEISLKYEGQVVELRIIDDGRGFNIDQAHSGRYGLTMMHERAESVGAALSVNSQPGHGTELFIKWKDSR